MHRSGVLILKTYHNVHHINHQRYQLGNQHKACFHLEAIAITHCVRSCRWGGVVNFNSIRNLQ